MRSRPSPISTSRGVSMRPPVILRNLHIRGAGIVNGNGADGIFFSSGVLLFGEADHVTIQRAGGTVQGGFGILAVGNVVFTVTNSNVLNAQLVGILAESGAVVNVDLSSVSSNNTAFSVNGGIIRVSGNAIYDNNTNFSVLVGGGQIATGDDNAGAVNGAATPNGTVSKF